MVTSFTAGKKAVNFDQFTPIPFTLIFKLMKHLSPGCIANTTSQLMVTNHVSDSKILNGDYAVSSNQISSQLVQEISTGIFDFGMYLGYFKSRFMSVIRAFGFPTQFLLRDFKLLIQPIEMLGIGYLFSVAGSQQTLDANINPHFFLRWWQCLLLAEFGLWAVWGEGGDG
jgi:hypothetical protein